MDALARALLSTAGSETGIVILCGNNLKARKRLAEQFAAYPNVSVRGFTKRPELYMDACDVLFTKPGGLTSTEAAVRGIPLIHRTLCGKPKRLSGWPTTAKPARAC